MGDNVGSEGEGLDVYGVYLQQRIFINKQWSPLRFKQSKVKSPLV